MSESKQCGSCREVLPRSAFHKDLQKRDGLNAYCRGCRARDRRAATPHALRKRPNARRTAHGKDCPRCGLSKAWADFGNNATARDGHQSYCRRCCTEVSAETAERQKVVHAARYAEKLARFAKDKATKVCRKCGQTKAHIDFYAHRGTKDGRTNECGACQREAAKRGRAGRLEEIRLDSARRHADPAFRARAARQRKRNWLLKYGLTPEGYDRLLAAQDSKCAICGQGGSHLLRSQPERRPRP